MPYKEPITAPELKGSRTITPHDVDLALTRHGFRSREDNKSNVTIADASSNLGGNSSSTEIIARIPVMTSTTS